MDAWTNMFQMDAFTLEKHVSDGCLHIGQTCCQWMYTSLWKMFIQMSTIEDAWTNMLSMNDVYKFVEDAHSDGCQRLKMLGQTCFGWMDANTYKFVENAWTLKSRCLDIQVVDAWTNTSQMETHTIYRCLDKHVYVMDLSKC